MRLIDADDLAAKIMMEAPDFMDGGSSITKAFILAMLGTRNATPTIDAVPVVRCKDCKHGGCRTQNTDGSIFRVVCKKHSTKRNDRWMDADWFCADGER